VMDHTKMIGPFQSPSDLAAEAAFYWRGQL
jgi:hypothetical protein